MIYMESEVWDGQFEDRNHEGLFAALAGQPADVALMRKDGEGGGGGICELAEISQQRLQNGDDDITKNANILSDDVSDVFTLSLYRLY